MSKALRNAALTVAATLGRFGETVKTSPDAFQEEISVRGTSAGKQASRHKVVKPLPRKTSIHKEWFGHQKTVSARIYYALTVRDSQHGRCTDWIRENRRRRAAGMPQLRAA